MAEKISVKSKIAYGLSDVASNLSWGTVGSFITLMWQKFLCNSGALCF
jgi:Na+/melibiose symporter-like transporter